MPQVDAAREFLEIAADSANPLDLVREAISNSYDAQATEIHIRFEVFQTYGESQLRIIIDDNGDGMDEQELAAFFDLGRSPRAVAKAAYSDSTLIGEKGHGTKIYFNSDQVEVPTHRDGRTLLAKMERPFACLSEGRLPRVEKSSRASEVHEKGTRIELVGYNRNRRELHHPVPRLGRPLQSAL